MKYILVLAVLFLCYATPVTACSGTSRGVVGRRALLQPRVGYRVGFVSSYRQGYSGRPLQWWMGSRQRQLHSTTRR